MNNIGLFIKTCNKDHEWLIDCITSIDKYAYNFAGLCIVTDSDHKRIRDLTKIISHMPINIHMVELPSIDHTCQDGIGYLWMQNIKLLWHKFCSFETILQIDSDFVIESKLSPEFYIINNKWKWFVRPWDFAELGIVHKYPMEKFLKIQSAYEHMPVPSWILTRTTTENFHKWVQSEYKMSWWDYLVNYTKEDWGKDIDIGTSRGSSVYNAYGGFLEISQPNEYQFVNVIDNNWQNLPPIKQYWSWENKT